jgi:hypothetical protein
MNTAFLSSMRLTFQVASPCACQHRARRAKRRRQILAMAPAIAAVCVLPGTPNTALADAFNRCFRVEKKTGNL